MVYDRPKEEDEDSDTPAGQQADEYEIESDEGEPEDLEEVPHRDVMRRVTMMQINMEKLGIKSDFDPSGLFKSVIGRNVNKFDQSYSREEASPQ